MAEAVVEIARAIEEREAEAMAAAWWAKVQRRCEKTRLELRALAESADRPIDVSRWRRAARLPALLAALPGFADLWVHRVPSEDLRAPGIFSCRCGHEHALKVGVVVICPGEGCRRWFLRTEKDVRVKRWPAEPADDGVELGA